MFKTLLILAGVAASADADEEALVRMEESGVSTDDADYCVEGCSIVKHNAALAAAGKDEVDQIGCDYVYCLKENCPDGAFAAFFPAASPGVTLATSEANCVKLGFTTSSTTSSTSTVAPTTSSSTAAPTTASSSTSSTTVHAGDFREIPVELTFVLQVATETAAAIAAIPPAVKTAVAAFFDGVHERDVTVDITGQSSLGGGILGIESQVVVKVRKAAAEAVKGALRPQSDFAHAVDKSMMANDWVMKSFLTAVTPEEPRVPSSTSSSTTAPTSSTTSSTTVAASSTTSSTTVPASSEVAVTMTFDVEATVEELNTIAAGKDNEFNSAFKTSVAAALDGVLEKDVTINKLVVVATATAGRRVNGKSVQVVFTVMVNKADAAAVKTALDTPSVFNAAFAKSMTDNGQPVNADSTTVKAEEPRVPTSSTSSTTAPTSVAPTTVAPTTSNATGTGASTVNVNITNKNSNININSSANNSAALSAVAAIVGAAAFALQ